MMKLRDACLVAGVREADYWQMTVGEAMRELDAYGERRRDQAYFAYTNAMAVGLFVGSMFGGHAPKIQEIYPELFKEDEEAEKAVQDEKSAANFINFANAFNRNLDNGDRKSESENNG